MGPYSVMDTAYAAGLFDGEGCIRINRQQFPNHVRYVLHVTVNMSDPRPLAALKETFGGSLYAGTARKKPSHRPLHTWTISSHAAGQFLRHIYPYLIVKAQEAKLGIEFQSGILRNSSQPVTAEEYERRERIRQEMVRLKHVVYDPAAYGMVANSADPENRQRRAKQPREIAVGVCNEQVPPATAKTCSGLHRNVESKAETTLTIPVIFADWVPEGKWFLLNPADLKRRTE